MVRTAVTHIPRWMMIPSSGSIMEYIAQRPHANRIELVYGVSQGLEFLHGKQNRSQFFTYQSRETLGHEIVHGDIKPVRTLH